MKSCDFVEKINPERKFTRSKDQKQEAMMLRKGAAGKWLDFSRGPVQSEERDRTPGTRETLFVPAVFSA